MPEFSSEEGLFKHLDELDEASRPQREELAWHQGVGMCMYEGAQWIDDTSLSRRVSGSVTRYNANWNPESRKLRAINNVTSMLVRKVSASTYLESVYTDVSVPDSTDPAAEFRARVHEKAINAAIDGCKMLNKARVAQFRRCVAGTWLLGLALESGVRVIDGVPMPDRHACAFESDPTCLVLDPSVQEMDLKDHDEVGYEDIITYEALLRMFPDNEKVRAIDRSRLKTMGQLDPVKEELGRLSSRRLFAKFAMYSNTKGVRICQYHVKDSTGYFGRWYVIVRDGDNNRIWLNPEETETPFGGCGMPFVMLHGHWRADSMWSWGDTHHIRDEQDKLNMAETLFWRVMQKHAGTQIFVDKRVFGSRATEDDIARKFTNQAYAVIAMELSDRVRNFQMPQLVQHPPPPPFLPETLARYEEKAERKSSLAPGHFGSTPTHVPATTTARVLDEADQPLGVRVKNDIQAYNDFTHVLHGTTIKLLQSENPGTLAMLHDAGFDDMEYAELFKSDPVKPDVLIEINEATVRYRSQAAAKQDLEFAAMQKLISPEDYIAGMGESLNTPITPYFRQMQSAARKAAMMILSGGEWTPRPLGRWNAMYVEQFSRAIGLTQDPAAIERLSQAMQMQYDIAYREQIAANPELRAQYEAAQSEQAAQAQDQERIGEAASPADLLENLIAQQPAA